MNMDKFKDYFGIILFLLSISILLFMIVSPLNGIIVHSDEYFTLGSLKYPFHDSMLIYINDVHPPLYYLMINALDFLLNALHLGSISFFIYKMLSVIPYALILLVGFFKIRKDYGWLATGLFTIAIATTSSFFIYFLAIRMYSWALFFFLMSFIYYKDIITNPDRNSWILFTAFTLLGAYTHYFAALSSVALYLLLLIKYLAEKNNGELKRFFISVATLVICYLPWIYALSGQLGRVHDTFWVKPVTSETIIKCLCYFSTAENSLFIQAISIAFIAISIAILVMKYKSFEKSDNFYILSGIYVFVASIALGAVISLIFKPILVPRYLMPCSAVLWLAISILISKMDNFKAMTILIILMLLLCVSGLNDVIHETEDLCDDDLAKTKLIKSLDGKIVIINGDMGLASYGPMLNKSKLYSFELSNDKGINYSSAHKFVDFTEFNESEMDNFISQNEGKDIYVLDAYGTNEIHYDAKEIGKIGTRTISKIKF